jgi:hypothetical protein
MKLILAFVFAVSLMAQPVISNAAADNITQHGARIGWTTNINSTARILVGLTDPPTTSITVHGGARTTHVGFVSGLNANTLYYWRACSTSGSEACTTSATFTTAVAAPGIATPPQSPTLVDTSMPTVNGSTLTVASDCSDLQSQINAAAALDGAFTHAVVIPAGTECVGRYTMTPKSGANPTGPGQIIITSSGTIVPPQTRVDPSTAVNYAKLIGNYFYAYYQGSDPGSCMSSEVLVRTDTFAVKICTSPNTWTTQTVTTGSGAPSSSCVEGAWYRNTSEADLRKAYWWCTGTNRNRNLYIGDTNNFTDWSVIRSNGSTRGYRITGLTIQDIERPSSYYALLPTTSGNGDERGSKSFCLASTTSTDSFIFFDRVLFEGQGYPHRQQEAICFFDGSNVAVINSYFSEINTWRPTSAAPTNTHAVFFLNGNGPAAVKNNYFLNVSGMAVFMSDDNPIGQTNDVEISRNVFLIETRLNRSEPINMGVNFFFRHHFELKRGERWWIWGNVFNGGFPSEQPNAASIGLTPTNGGSTSLQCRTNTIRIGDINITLNRFMWNPMAFLFTGHSVTGGGGCQTLTSERVAFTNNAIYNLGRSSTGTTAGIGGYQYNGQLLETGNGWQDFTFSNNSNSNPLSACCNAHMFNFGGEWTQPNSRFLAESNMYWSTTIGFQWGMAISSTGIYGTDALNNRVVPNSTWRWVANARQRGQTGGLDNNPTYPAGNYSSQTPTDFSADLYQCVSCGDPGPGRPLPTGKFASGSSVARGANGYSAGADFTALDSALGTLSNVRVLPSTITPSGATVAYTAPDTAACTVEYGTSALPNTGLRVNDTPAGSRVRTVALSGLTANTTYHVRVFCARTGIVSFATKP